MRESMVYEKLSKVNVFSLLSCLIHLSLFLTVFGATIDQTPPELANKTPFSNSVLVENLDVDIHRGQLLKAEVGVQLLPSRIRIIVKRGSKNPNVTPKKGGKVATGQSSSSGQGTSGRSLSSIFLSSYSSSQQLQSPPAAGPSSSSSQVQNRADVVSPALAPVPVPAPSSPEQQAFENDLKKLRYFVFNNCVDKRIQNSIEILKHVLSDIVKKPHTNPLLTIDESLKSSIIYKKVYDQIIGDKYKTKSQSYRDHEKTKATDAVREAYRYHKVELKQNVFDILNQHAAQLQVPVEQYAAFRNVVARFSNRENSPAPAAAQS